MKTKVFRLFMLVGTTAFFVATTFLALALVVSAEWLPPDERGDGESPAFSHRLIVELQSPALTRHYHTLPGARTASGKMAIQSAAARSYLQQIRAEQDLFMSQVGSLLPRARVSTYVNENGVEIEQRFQLVMNAVVVNTGSRADAGASEAEIEALRRLPGVKQVYRDYAYQPQLSNSTSHIHADAVWSMLGGRADAGRGIKIASMDGGIHKDAPMFSGEGFDYPPGFPEDGLGLTANNNGKIIASRVYFRSWDPPAAGDENPWPGVAGTSHGVHTAGIAAGNVVSDATYLGNPLPAISGVAPGAWVGSYRVFYMSVNGIQSFYTAEGIAALEDIVRDGMDVVNNSWGGGPGSRGGEFDALDMALINAAQAGVFVTMSAGNAGPHAGTSLHPSIDYITVAASNGGGGSLVGFVSVKDPEPVSSGLKNMPMRGASFGATIPMLATAGPFQYKAAVNVDPANVNGCTAWPADAFTGLVAVIRRGGACQFATKAHLAQQAGAVAVVIYNNSNDSPMSMGTSADAVFVTIPVVAVGQSNGLALAAWQNSHPETAALVINTPDVIANFSSRGPSTRNSLKPDIAAPGMAVISQGYTSGATGEARHLGYGAVSGTSMAAPHVAGAAALLRSLYPDWSNSDIKSALMSTSSYLEIYTQSGLPAQPVDMGAGRLDVEAAVTPGVILNPPAADFGLVMSTSVESAIPVSVTILVKNIYTATETYTATTLYTGDGFDDLKPLAGVSVTPQVITLQPGETQSVQVSFDPVQGMGYDINQGYIVLAGDLHEAHLPFFARVIGARIADVLLVDVDFSPESSLANYSAYYTSTLENLGLSYLYWDTTAMSGGSRTLPDFATLYAFDTVVIFTGDNIYRDGSFTVPTPLTRQDMNLLNEYAQAGGRLLVMGQNATKVMNNSFFQLSTLGAARLQESVTSNGQPNQPILSYANTPSAFKQVWLDLTGPQEMLGQVALLGVNESPPVDNTAQISGTASFHYSNITDELSYLIEIDVSEPFSITNAHIHTGTVGVSGGVVASLFPFTQTQLVTESISWSGVVPFTPEQNAHREAGGYYVNIHTSAHPSGEVRGQLPHAPVVGDGAGNNLSIDEFVVSSITDDPNPVRPSPYRHLLRYPGPYNMQEGSVAILHRDQPMLERPGISYFGRSIVTSFGLEAVNSSTSSMSREALMTLFLKWAMDEPDATILQVGEGIGPTESGFTFEFASNVPDAQSATHRWDFGDGSDYTGEISALTPVVTHSYAYCGDYTVRLEITDTYGNKRVIPQDVTITACQFPPQYTITANAEPSAGGMVDGGGLATHGETVTVTATANDGYNFINWREDGGEVSTGTTYTFTATGDRTLTAHFALKSYTITANAEPTMGGVVDGGGLATHGETVTVTATANDGYNFVNWTEDGGEVSTGATYTFTATGDRTLTAHFALKSYTITANVEPAAGGVVDGGGLVTHGETVTLTATANDGYNFVNWTEDEGEVSVGAIYTFTATGDRTLTGNFVLNERVYRLFLPIISR